MKYYIATRTDPGERRYEAIWRISQNLDTDPPTGWLERTSLELICTDTVVGCKLYELQEFTRCYDEDYFFGDTYMWRDAECIAYCINTQIGGDLQKILDQSNIRDAVKVKGGSERIVWVFVNVAKPLTGARSFFNFNLKYGVKIEAAIAVDDLRSIDLEASFKRDEDDCRRHVLQEVSKRLIV